MINIYFKKKSILIISIAFMILFSLVVNAELINPQEVVFNKVLRGGFAQENIVITGYSEEEVPLEISVAGYSKDWIKLDQDSFKVSKTKPAQFKLSIAPPLDSPLGEIQGLLILSLYFKTNDSLTSSSNAISTIKIKTITTTQEITEAEVGDIEIKDSQQGSPIEISLNIKNKGNTLLEPKIEMSVFNENMELVKTNYNSLKIQPTLSEKAVLLTSSEGMKEGRYKAEIKVKINNDFIKSVIVPFELFKFGSLHSKGNIVEIKNDAYSKVSDKIPITAYFQNSGDLNVPATFYAQIYLKDNLVKELKSEPKNSAIGTLTSLTTEFIPELTGTYIIKGYVSYDNKKTETIESYVNVGIEQYLPLSSTPLLLGLLFIIICLGYYSYKLRKSKKRRR